MYWVRRSLKTFLFIEFVTEDKRNCFYSDRMRGRQAHFAAYVVGLEIGQSDKGCDGRLSCRLFLRDLKMATRLASEHSSLGLDDLWNRIASDFSFIISSSLDTKLQAETRKDQRKKEAIFISGAHSATAAQWTIKCQSVEGWCLFHLEKLSENTVSKGCVWPNSS